MTCWGDRAKKSIVIFCCLDDSSIVGKVSLVNNCLLLALGFLTLPIVIVQN
jgi:hypothetical protein